MADAYDANLFNGLRSSKRTSRRARAAASAVSETVTREPTEVEIIAAVESLCTDQLLPYGRIIRKRLAELAESESLEAPDVDVGRLRILCTACDRLAVNPEGEADWSAVIKGQDTDFVDIYSSEDDYSEEFWLEAAEYFESLGSDEMNFPGGRYVCAQFLASRSPNFLEGFSLGKVCHVVQIAMTQRKLLGYLNGAIVPYSRSQTAVKEQCAEQQRLCRKNKLPLATWDVLRTCLYEMLEGTRASDVGGLPLSNVKRVLRARFRVDLSETALGHATVCDLFRDERLSDLCSVKLLDNGYVVFPSFPQGAPSLHDPALAAYLDPWALHMPPVPPPAGLYGNPYHPYPIGYHPLPPLHEGIPTVPPITRAPGGLVAPGGHAWDMTCHLLGMPRSPSGNNSMCPYGDLLPNTSPLKARDGTEAPPVLLGTNAPVADSGSFAKVPEGGGDEWLGPDDGLVSEDGCASITDVGSDQIPSVPPTPAILAPPTPSPGPAGLPSRVGGFASLIENAVDEEASESDNDQFKDEEQPEDQLEEALGGAAENEPGVIGGQRRPSRDSSDQRRLPTPNTMPPTPFLAFGATPSPGFNRLATFSSMMNHALEEEGSNPAGSIPATPALFMAETPSPFQQQGAGFSQLLQAAVHEDSENELERPERPERPEPTLKPR